MLKDAFVAGSHWVIHVPPVWLLGGTVVEADEDTVVFQDCVYLESSGKEKTNIGDVPMATSVSEQLAASASSHQIPDGLRVRRDAILLAVPAAMSLRALSTRNAVAAVKRAK